MGAREFQERLADRPFFIQPEKKSKRCGDVSEGLTHTDRPGCSVMFHEQRHLLARMVRAAKSRVIAMIGGDDDQVLGLAAGKETREPLVELPQRIRVAVDVAAVTVQHVEIDQVHEEKPIMRALP